MGTETYLLDASIYIEASRRYYAFDFGTKFWDCLKKHGEGRRVVSIDRVGDELKNGYGDALKKWACEECDGAFLSTQDPDVYRAYADLQQWAQSSTQFFPKAKADFAACADAWLVAYAKAKNCTVVTHERSSKDVKARVLIPNACEKFGVPYVNTFQMLRTLGAKLA